MPKEFTVAQLMQMLSKMNPDAVVCTFNPDDVYNSIETCCEVKNATYVNDDGDFVVGDIVFIY